MLPSLLLVLPRTEFRQCQVHFQFLFNMLVDTVLRVYLIVSQNKVVLVFLVDLLIVPIIPEK